MNLQENGRIFCFSAHSLPPEILKEGRDVGFDIVRFSDPREALPRLFPASDPTPSDPLEAPILLVADDRFPGLDGIGLVGLLNRFWPEVPILICLDEFDNLLVSRLISAGAFDFVLRPYRIEQIKPIVRRALQVSRNNLKKLKTIEELEHSEGALQEKTLVLETILELLSHDSRNMFLNIQALINQLDESPLVGMLDDAVDELYQRTCEAIGYLGAGRRIEAIDELVGNLKTTRSRIPLSSHPRIRFSSSLHSLLFAEVTSLFKNAVTNIVENALKYSPEDQPIDVRVERVEESIRIRVTDYGQGIPDCDKERIFHRDFRRKQTASVEGSGKGLWITRNILRKEGCVLTVKDNPKGGSVFEIFMTAYWIEDLETGLLTLEKWYKLDRKKIEDKAENIRTLLTLQGLEDQESLDSLIFVNLLDYFRRSKLRSNRKTLDQKLLALKQKNPEGPPVLIVDDSAFVHYYLGTYFTDLGYRIVAFAQNGREGVAYYQEFNPDIVTLDVTMPVLSGIDAAREIREGDPEAKIIFLTGLGDLKSFRENLHLFFGDRIPNVLTKPFEKQQLEALLTQL